MNLEKAITIAANGNVHAKEYLELIAGIARRIDDIHDEDHGKVDAGLLAYLCLVALPSNPFFCVHAARLIPLHDLVINAWQDSNQLDPALDQWSLVYCDLVNEIACSVAGITGGYTYRRKVSLELRQLLYEREITEGAPGESNGPLVTRHSSLVPN